MFSSKLSTYHWLWLGGFITMLGVAVPRYKAMTMTSKASGPDASLELMCRAQFETTEFPQQFLERIKGLPENRAILLMQTPGTKPGVSSLLSYLAWPRPIVIRTGTLRDSVNLEGLLRGGVSAVVLADQDAPPDFPNGERLSPAITYIPLRPSGS